MRPEPTGEQVRATLDRLTVEHNTTLAALSRMIRRSDGYLAYFVREGVPARLADRDRKLLAAFFSVEEWELGGYILPKPRR